MSEPNVIAIKILKRIPLFGSGDTLETRLRKVRLRGFDSIQIYKDAAFKAEFLTPEEIRNQLHTPQPNVYATHLKRIETLAGLFRKQGIDILNLEEAYDFVAKADNGEETEWTMIPPIIEEWTIQRTEDGNLDYEPLIGEELRQELAKSGLWLNQGLKSIEHSSPSNKFNLINDGTHRVHYGFLTNGVKILKVSNLTSGYPYYAAPQPYSTVKVMPEPSPETTAMKIHVINEPGQKLLYRLFPTGGIKTGEVRPPTEGEMFI